MQKKRVRKLQLSTETLLNLSREEIGQAVGGAATELCTVTCTKPIVCTGKCPTVTAVAPGGECCS
jgi:hypothetical protein